MPKTDIKAAGERRKKAIQKLVAKGLSRAEAIRRALRLDADAKETR